jgi:hypothetical protein
VIQLDPGCRPIASDRRWAVAGWFSSLVGWSGGLYGPSFSVEQTRMAAGLLIVASGQDLSSR